MRPSTQAAMGVAPSCALTLDQLHGSPRVPRLHSRHRKALHTSSDGICSQLCSRGCALQQLRGSPGALSYAWPHSGCTRRALLSLDVLLPALQAEGIGQMPLKQPPNLDPQLAASLFKLCPCCWKGPGTTDCINTFSGGFLQVICGGLAAGTRLRLQLPRYRVTHSLKQRWLRTPADSRHLWNEEGCQPPASFDCLKATMAKRPEALPVLRMACSSLGSRQLQASGGRRSLCCAQSAAGQTVETPLAGCTVRDKSSAQLRVCAQQGWQRIPAPRDACRDEVQQSGWHEIKA